MNDRALRKREGKSPSALQYTVETMTVGSGRSAEPYIMAFHYSSDNVAGKNLGTLFGFFEVEVHDNDAAYIVNFLASVAKKEYFANPRRDVEDGFETTLHKINVALAEIAKEGNISWLGHLHGIVAAISRDTVYFSATGDGVLSLARDGSFRPISDGLAEVLSEPHPLKTFTEVASGKLAESDVLLVLSPAVWTLFTPDDLKKNIARLGRQDFNQFLHTALINELPLAAAVIINVAKEVPPLVEPKKASPEPVALDNIWSERPFAQARMARLSPKPPTIATEPSPPPKEKEYVDQKTGHIYLQGDTLSTTPPATPWQASLALSAQSFSQTWQKKRADWQRAGRRTKKQMNLWWAMFGIMTRTTGKRLGRRGRTLWRRFQEERARRQEDKTPSPTTDTPAPREVPPSPAITTPPATTSWRTKWQQPLTSVDHETPISPVVESAPVENAPPRAWSLAPVLKNFLGQIRAMLATLTSTLRHSFAIGASWIQQRAQTIRPWWTARTRREQSSLLGGATLLLTVGLAILWYAGRSPLWDEPAPAAPAQETVQETAPAPLGQGEPQATILSESRVLFPLEVSEAVISLDTLDRVPYMVTTKRLVNLATQESITLPTTPRLAAAMDDLNGMFLLGNDQTLTFYTPSNKKFTTNTLALPAGTRIDALDCYLTYLYVLDRTAGTIYRFPRAEGGFGTPITWSKATLATEAASPMLVSDNITIVQPNGLPAGYERGRPTTAPFTPPVSSPHVTALTSNPETTDLFALDPQSKRVLRWSVTGTLMAQYFHEDFADATQLLLVNNSELLIARPSGIFTFSLQ